MKPSRLRSRLLAVVVTAGLLAGCILCPAKSGRYGPIDQYTRADDAAKVADDLKAHPDDINFQDDAGRTPLHLAAEGCRLHVIPVLLAHGADPNCRAKGGATPLHLAAQEGCQAAAELLLAAHADINARDDAGRTPLARAEQWHQPALASYLEAHGGTK